MEILEGNAVIEKPKARAKEMNIEIKGVPSIKMVKLQFWPPTSEMFKNVEFQARCRLPEMDDAQLTSVLEQIQAGINIFLGVSDYKLQLGDTNVGKDGEEMVIWGTIQDKGTPAGGPVKVEVVEGSTGQRDGLRLEDEEGAAIAAQVIQMGMRESATANLQVARALHEQLQQQKEADRQSIEAMQMTLHEMQEARTDEREALLQMIQDQARGHQVAQDALQERFEITLTALQAQQEALGRRSDLQAEALTAALDANAEQQRLLRELVGEGETKQVKIVNLMINELTRQIDQISQEPITLDQASQMIRLAQTTESLITQETEISAKDVLTFMQKLSELQARLKKQTGTEVQVAQIDDLGHGLREKYEALSRNT